MKTLRLTLRQLLAMTQGKFEVPTYQRRYVWAQQRPGMRDSATYLAQCIHDMIDSDSNLFLNGISLMPQGPDKPYEIIDGQQRITFLRLLLLFMQWHSKQQDRAPHFSISYECRPSVQEWMRKADNGSFINLDSLPSPDSQDTYLFGKSLEIMKSTFGDKEIPIDKILDSISFLCIRLDNPAHAIAAFKMMNGTKQPMGACDVIKADIMRMASNPNQPRTSELELAALCDRYASEWEDWSRWWNRTDVREYYSGLFDNDSLPITLLIKLCLRDHDFDRPLVHEEYRLAIESTGIPSWHASKHFFSKLRHAQKRFEDAFEDAASYNRIKAVLLLQSRQQSYTFLKSYFVDASIGQNDLIKAYKLSFLGMDFEEIVEGVDYEGKFDELLASISMADVYHSEAKRDAYNLLLRLNIDEDIKLGRKFDFSIWNNRSLEHIYSKSKVWHQDASGHLLDGNDNPIREPLRRIVTDSDYLSREAIVNNDGVQLTEHCIGNLVLLYGQNNASFGNAGFEQKKAMFLAPGTMGEFRSRNLLHSVCVFAEPKWTGQSIVDNYNRTLKNLKLYYKC